MEAGADGGIREILEIVVSDQESTSLAVHDRVVGHQKPVTDESVPFNPGVRGCLVHIDLVQGAIPENIVLQEEAVCPFHEDASGANGFESTSADDDRIGVHAAETEQPVPFPIAQEMKALQLNAPETAVLHREEIRCGTGIGLFSLPWREKHIPGKAAAESQFRPDPGPIRDSPEIDPTPGNLDHIIDSPDEPLGKDDLHPRRISLGDLGFLLATKDVEALAERHADGPETSLFHRNQGIKGLPALQVHESVFKRRNPLGITATNQGGTVSLQDQSNLRIRAVGKSQMVLPEEIGPWLEAHLHLLFSGRQDRVNPLVQPIEIALARHGKKEG